MAAEIHGSSFESGHNGDGDNGKTSRPNAESMNVDSVWRTYNLRALSPPNC